jgi:hypothetical protein
VLRMSTYQPPPPGEGETPVSITRTSAVKCSLESPKLESAQTSRVIPSGKVGRRGISQNNPRQLKGCSFKKTWTAVICSLGSGSSPINRKVGIWSQIFLGNVGVHPPTRARRSEAEVLHDRFGGALLTRYKYAGARRNGARLR